jgi:branched-chain amino acid transport system permease protein
MAFGPYLLLALMEGLVKAAVLALTAVGLSLVFGVMRVVNVAHGAFFMLGAVLAFTVAQYIPGPAALGWFAALVIAPMIVAAIAAAADTLVLKRLNYDPEATIVATIGLLYILEQAALSFFGPDAKPVEAPFTLRLQLPWFGFSGYKLFVDRQTARAFSINVDRVYAGVFALGAALAAIAAVLLVPISQAHYLMGGDPLLLSFIVVIIGGLGSLRGTIVAALIIGISDGVISMFYSPTLAKIIATAAVAMVLVFRPQGLFGART